VNADAGELTSAKVITDFLADFTAEFYYRPIVLCSR